MGRMMVKANNNAKVAKVAGVAGVAVTAGTTLAAQGALAANEAYQVAATFNLEDEQVFGAVFISLIAGILATRLGTELYKSRSERRSPTPTGVRVREAEEEKKPPTVRPCN